MKNQKKGSLTFLDIFPDLDTNFPDHFRYFTNVLPIACNDNHDIVIGSN